MSLELQAPPSAGTTGAKLTIPRAEALRMLKLQLEKGLEIKRAKIRYVPELERAREAKGEWATATLHMLRQMFNTNAVADECQAWHGKVLPEYADLNLFIEHFYDEMDQRLRKLHVVLRRVQETADEPARPIATPAAAVKVAAEPVEMPRPAAAVVKAAPARPRSGVLIVCAPNAAAQAAVGEFVTRLGLELVEVSAVAGSEPRLCDQLDARPHLDFALVLTRPDAALTPFDLGYCVGRLGPKRVHMLAPAEAQLTSDAHGLLHIPLDPADGWQLHLARQFKRAGLEVDLNRVF